MRAPDPAFADPRLAALYDPIEGARPDLDAVVALAGELGATTVVDVGCGTGVLALRLAALGLRVVGVDPATASVDVARRKPGADAVTWVAGDAEALAGLGLHADLAVMTGNVAMVFVDDADWHATLAAIAACLRPGGWLALETRRAEARDWETWDLLPTPSDLPGVRLLSRRVTEVALPLLTFQSTTVLDDGEELVSTSTLRFRQPDELRADLARHGLDVVEIREAPDRPGLEHVVLARRSAS